MMKKLKAFTLIELMIVIVIIGLLAAMILPVVNEAKKQAQQKQQQTTHQNNSISIGDKVFNGTLGITGVVNQINGNMAELWVKDGTNSPTLSRGINIGILTRIPASDEWKR